MNKAELIADIESRTGIGKNNVEVVLTGLADSITDALKNGDDVTLQRIGKFGKRHRKESTGRNPRSGAPMLIAAKEVPTFKASKALSDQLN